MATKTEIGAILKSYLVNIKICFIIIKNLINDY